MKVCNKCNLEKDYKSFYKDKTKKDGYMNSCKECKSKYSNENKGVILDKKKDYYLKNKEEILIKYKMYYSENKEDLLNKSKEYYLNNKESKIQYQKNYYNENKDIINRYRRKNRDKINLYFNNRYHSDIVFRITKILRNVITRAIRDNGYTKKSSTFEILGCSYQEFRIYIENQFKDGMNWENQGEWHLDHKIPISWANTEDEVYKLNHYTNFQPLWAIDNQIKNNKYADE